MKTKTVIVTGASRGIGRVIATSFAKKGSYNLVAVARSIEDLESLQQELQPFHCEVLPVTADLVSVNDVKNMVSKTLSKFDTIDILVNNAGTSGPTASIEDTSIEAWLDVMNNNLTSTFLCSKFVVPVMKSNNWGRIINLSSISGKRPLPFRAGYAAAKMGVIGLTRTLASELGPYGITVNAVCPGFVDGERMSRVIAGQSEVRSLDSDIVMSEMVNASPLKRFVQPQEVAQMVMYLSREEAAGITGEDINVSAGVVMY